ncbi:hypothetical protein, partial [Klebsiella pneumoniae]|uniref:hypothetical protein n=1 Tax=Klebsiella pneumoniae TaxID=573 RepID=UPI00197BE08E
RRAAVEVAKIRIRNRLDRRRFDIGRCTLGVVKVGQGGGIAQAPGGHCTFVGEGLAQGHGSLVVDRDGDVLASGCIFSDAVSGRLGTSSSRHIVLKS